MLFICRLWFWLMWNDVFLSVFTTIAIKTNCRSSCGLLCFQFRPKKFRKLKKFFSLIVSLNFLTTLLNFFAVQENVEPFLLARETMFILSLSPPSLFISYLLLAFDMEMNVNVSLFEVYSVNYFVCWRHCQVLAWI